MTVKKFYLSSSKNVSHTIEPKIKPTFTEWIRLIYKREPTSKEIVRNLVNQLIYQ